MDYRQFQTLTTILLEAHDRLAEQAEACERIADELQALNENLAALHTAALTLLNSPPEERRPSYKQFFHGAN